VYRTFRLAEFVTVLWLLTPWWGRRDLLLIRCHLRALMVILGSVLLGLLVAPGSAMAGGRLTGVLWGIPATQVAHYAAVMLGLVVVLWLCRQVRGPGILLIVIASVIILALTHTRTALIAVVTGILVSGLSLVVAKARVRRFLVAASSVVLVAAITLSRVITTWLARGQGTGQLTELTGRTKVWGPLLAFPRDKFRKSSAPACRMGRSMACPSTATGWPRTRRRGSSVSSSARLSSSSCSSQRTSSRTVSGAPLPFS
jgi:hypothetical protein